MATKVWIGGAGAVKQVATCTVGGTVEVGDLFILAIGSKSLSIAAASTTPAEVAAAIVAAWNALDSTFYPEFAEITAADGTSGAFTLTSDTAGKPFTVTLTTTESNGDAADTQTFTQEATTANSGPNVWGVAANWDTGAVPVDGDDVVFENSDIDCLYDLDQSAVTLASLTVRPTYTGSVGLLGTNNDNTSYPEYRPQYLQVSATAVNIETGGQRFRLDTGSAQTTVNISGSGTEEETGVPVILWTGTHASNVVNITKGSFGAAFFTGETATIASYNQGSQENLTGDVEAVLGAGCTITTITKDGGRLEIRSSFTTLNQRVGDTDLVGGTPGTLNLYGGRVLYRTSGNYTAANIYDGAELDFRRDIRAVTGTNTTIYSGGILRDPSKRVTFTNPISVQCDDSKATLQLGAGYNLQRS